MMILLVIVLVSNLLMHILLDSVTCVHNINHIVYGWQALKLILNHFLVFWLLAKDPLEERADIFDL